MKIANSAVTSVALIACSVMLAQAAPKTKDQSPAAQARAILEQVDSLSLSMANEADKLALGARSAGGDGTQLVELDGLRADINRIGRDLRTLQDEEESLPAWQSHTLDQVLPLMQEIATNTEDAIQNFNENRNHVWSTAFPDETAKIYADAERVRQILSGNLKLAAAREEEHHIENTLNQ
jgi:hypothetical protein